MTGASDDVQVRENGGASTGAETVFGGGDQRCERASRSRRYPPRDSQGGAQENAGEHQRLAGSVVIGA